MSSRKVGRYSNNERSVTKAATAPRSWSIFEPRLSNLWVSWQTVLFKVTKIVKERISASSSDGTCENHPHLPWFRGTNKLSDIDIMLFSPPNPPLSLMLDQSLYARLTTWRNSGQKEEELVWNLSTRFWLTYFRNFTTIAVNIPIHQKLTVILHRKPLACAESTMNKQEHRSGKH